MGNISKVNPQTKMDPPLRRELLGCAARVKSSAHSLTGFDDLVQLRLSWAEDECARPGLMRLEDKLWQRSLAARANVPCPTLLGSLGGHCTEEEVIDTLRNLPQRAVVIKPTHLHTAVIAEGGPDGIRRAAGACLRMLRESAAENEAKPLRMAPPRLMIEELVEVHYEVRVLTVFGAVVGAASDGSTELTDFSLEEELSRAAQAMAREAKSDLLRCDFFVLNDGSFVLNRCCAFLWPAGGFFSDCIYQKAFAALVEGHRRVASPTVVVEPVDEFVWRVTQNYAACACGDPGYMTLAGHFYIVVGTESAALIDGGCGISAEAVYKALGWDREHPSKRLDCILTHWHDDHLYGVAASSESSIVDVFVHPLDSQKVRDALPRFRVQEIGEENARLELGGVSLSVLHTPGHTEGSVSILTDQGHIFTGDSFLEGGELMFLGDLDAVERSLNKLIEVSQNGCYKVYPGHGLIGVHTDCIIRAAEALSGVREKGWLELEGEEECMAAWHSHLRSCENATERDEWWVEWDPFLGSSVVQVGDYSFSMLRENHEH